MICLALAEPLGTSSARYDCTAIFARPGVCSIELVDRFKTDKSIFWALLN
jgi:hypothetical protein